MARPASDARERALAAAIALLCDGSGKALTIDAVAKEAGVSKGGVLHHFRTKDTLVLEVVQALVDQWEATLEAKMRDDPQPVGRFVRALMSTLAEPFLTQVGRGLLAAVALDPNLLEPMRDSYRRSHDRIARDGLDPALAYQCVLVADALWYGAIFDLPPPPDDVVSALRERLEASTHP